MKQLVDGIIQRVKGIVSPILLNEGMELVDIEYRRESRGWVLRLFIDKEGGVTLENCAHISEELGRTLDVEDFIPNPYILEVSSPGLDRPLKKEKDFIKYLQHRIKVKTFDPIEQRRNFRGKLLRVTEGRIELDLEDRIIQIPLSNVAKANLEIDF
ncbi:MAG: ribosome maturation factor RimP [Thermodesulfobacteriota bacterium]